MESLHPWRSAETGVDGHDEGGQGHEDGPHRPVRVLEQRSHHLRSSLQ